MFAYSDTFGTGKSVAASQYNVLALTLFGNARDLLGFSHLRKAEDGGQDPCYDEIDARQLLAELDGRSQREYQPAQFIDCKLSTHYI